MNERFLEEGAIRSHMTAESCQIIAPCRNQTCGERYRWSKEPDSRREKQQQSQRSLLKILVSVSRCCVSLAGLCAALSRRLTLQSMAVFSTELGLLCRNRIGLPVGFRGAHAARCKLSVLSKIIGYPKLIIVAKRYTKQ